jgi:hypothetical protein
MTAGLSGAGPRDATRGGVNEPALPAHPPEGGHRKAPLSIDEVFAAAELAGRRTK